jgi:hypothetical protein
MNISTPDKVPGLHEDRFHWQLVFWTGWSCPWCPWQRLTKYKANQCEGLWCHICRSLWVRLWSLLISNGLCFRGPLGLKVQQWSLVKMSFHQRCRLRWQQGRCSNLVMRSWYNCEKREPGCKLWILSWRLSSWRDDLLIWTRSVLFWTVSFTLIPTFIMSSNSAWIYHSCPWQQTYPPMM